MESRESKWRVWLHRLDGAESRSFRVDARAAVAVALGAAALLAALGAAAGVFAERRRESERVEELRAQVERLRERRRGVSGLAARLDSVERAYERLRASLAPADSLRPDPGLPAPPEGDVPSPAAADGGLPEGWPLARDGFVTRRFRAELASGEHPGLDVAVPTGSYIRAIASGAVREVGRDSVYGRFVRVGHAGGYVSLYGHAGHVFVRPGDSVAAGEVIGLSGNSGRSTAPHLHLELRRDGELVDPVRFLRGAN